MLEDNRFNSMVRLYEERIKYLEKMIEDMRTTPIPITIQVAYPNAPVAAPQAQVVGNEETQILEEKPTEEIEQAPETIVSEEVVVEETPVVEETIEEAVTPVVLDSTFENLTEEEKAAVVKKEMKNADKVDVDLVDPAKDDKKKSRKLRKLEKKQRKMQKIRDRNDLTIYRKNARKRFRRFILWLFLIALLLFLGVTTLGALIDYNVIPASLAETFDKYLSYVPPFGKDGVIRNTVKDIVDKVLNFVKGFIK